MNGLDCGRHYRLRPNGQPIDGFGPGGVIQQLYGEHRQANGCHARARVDRRLGSGERRNHGGLLPRGGHDLERDFRDDAQRSQPSDVEPVHGKARDVLYHVAPALDHRPIGQDGAHADDHFPREAEARAQRPGDARRQRAADRRAAGEGRVQRKPLRLARQCILQRAHRAPGLHRDGEVGGLMGHHAIQPPHVQGQVVARRRRPKSLPRAAAPGDNGRPELRGDHKGCAQLIDGGGQRNGQRLASRQRVLAGVRAPADARVLEAALEVSRDDARQRRRLPTGRWPGAAGTPRRKRPWGRSCRG